MLPAAQPPQTGAILESSLSSHPPSDPAANPIVPLRYLQNRSTSLMSTPISRLHTTAALPCFQTGLPASTFAPLWAELCSSQIPALKV